MYSRRSIVPLLVLPLFSPAFVSPISRAENGGTNASQNTSGGPASIGSVDPKKLFASDYKTKDIEQRVSAARAKAKEELYGRMASYKKAADELAALNGEIQKSPATQETVDPRIGTRDAKIAELKKQQEDIKAFQQLREMQVDEQAMRMRKAVVEDLNTAVEKAAKMKGTNLVLNGTGPSLNGIPFVLYESEPADITATVTALLPSRDGSPGPGARAVSGARVVLQRLAVVDMKKALEQYSKAADAEQRIAEANKSAKKDLDDRAAACKNLAADIKKLSDQIQNPALSAADKDSKVKQRDGKSDELKQAARSLQEFQQTRRKQLDEQTIRMRSGIAHDLENEITDIAHDANPDLVLDVSARGAKGLPAAVSLKRFPDLTDELIARVNSAPVPERKPFPAAPAIAFADFNRIFNALPEVREINQEEARLLAALGTDINARSAAQDAASQKKAPLLTKILEAIRAVAATQEADLILNTGEKSIDGVEFVLRHDGLRDLTGSVLEKLGLPQQ